MKDPVLYRRRLIPEECTLLKGDTILLNEPGLLVTGWHALKPRKDLHHGFSCYYFEEGYKISRFYDHDNQLLYHYCDIITHNVDTETNSITVTDLLADVIIYPDGTIKVVDIGEIPDAIERGLLSSEDLIPALRSLDRLLEKLYCGNLHLLTEPLDLFDPLIRK